MLVSALASLFFYGCAIAAPVVAPPRAERGLPAPPTMGRPQDEDDGLARRAALAPRDGLAPVVQGRPKDEDDNNNARRDGDGIYRFAYGGGSKRSISYGRMIDQDDKVYMNHYVQGDIWWSARIVNKKTGECLAAGSADNNALLYYVDCGSEYPKNWRKSDDHLVLVDDGGNWINNGLAIDLADGNGKVQVWSYTPGNTNQKWDMIRKY